MISSKIGAMIAGMITKSGTNRAISIIPCVFSDPGTVLNRFNSMLTAMNCAINAMNTPMMDQIIICPAFVLSRVSASSISGFIKSKVITKARAKLATVIYTFVCILVIENATTIMGTEICIIIYVMMTHQYLFVKIHISFILIFSLCFCLYSSH